MTEMKRFDVAGCSGYCNGGYHMKEDVDGEYVTYESHVEAMKRIAGDGGQQAEPVAYVGWGGEGKPKTLLLKADLPVGTSLYAKPVAQQAEADEEKIVCPECHGLGRVEVTHEPLRDGYTETIRECCDDCQGTGLLAASPAALTDSQIAAQDARYAIDGAITYGRTGTNKPPVGHWLAEYWSIGRQLARLGETSAWDNQTPLAASPAALTDEAAMRVALRIMANLEDRNGLLDGVDDDTKADIADEIAVTIRAASPADQVEDARIPGRVDTEWHDLKADAHVFEEVITGRKASEIRFDDRGYQVGHVLRLRETRHTGAEMKAGAPLEYTGREVIRVVSHIQRGYGLGDGWVCLSFDAAMSASKDGA